MPYSLDFFRDVCKSNGMRVTRQKIAIYKELMKSDNHPTPEQILNRLKKDFSGLSLDTVYRTLCSFTEIAYSSGRRFELPGGLTRSEKHHHFQCRKCRATDFTSEL